jgi:hypothetical protein
MLLLLVVYWHWVVIIIIISAFPKSIFDCMDWLWIQYCIERDLNTFYRNFLHGKELLKASVWNRSLSFHFWRNREILDLCLLIMGKLKKWESWARGVSKTKTYENLRWVSSAFVLWKQKDPKIFIYIVFAKAYIIKSVAKLI